MLTLTLRDYELLVQLFIYSFLFLFLFFVFRYFMCYIFLQKWSIFLILDVKIMLKN